MPSKHQRFCSNVNSRNAASRKYRRQNTKFLATIANHSEIEKPTKIVVKEKCPRPQKTVGMFDKSFGEKLNIPMSVVKKND